MAEVNSGIAGSEHSDQRHMGAWVGETTTYSMRFKHDHNPQYFEGFSGPLPNRAARPKLSRS
jgi:hypothetical protein